ncbi:MAG: zinc-ribbon domain-containing protein [Deltaproteobacteria bacterium]|nr:zinc-ribbon domain-containing protein [Deltaproteobacteria bacterium]
MTPKPCQHCGKPVNPKSRYCPHCGQENRVAEIFSDLPCARKRPTCTAFAAAP